MTPNTCQDIIANVSKQEDTYWSEDEAIDNVYAKNSEEETSSNSLSMYSLRGSPTSFRLDINPSSLRSLSWMFPGLRDYPSDLNNG